MCGRYSITSPPEAIRMVFGYIDRPNFPPRYNVAPTQPVPVVRIENGVRRFALVRWGLLPPWVKEPKAFSLLINARAETIGEKPAFRNAMRRRRCLFPCNGFYEWKQDGTGRKRVYHIRRKDGGVIAFAGLWEVWTGPNGEELETAAIVTTQANLILSAIHHRAPTIVPPEAFDLWLDTVNVDEDAAAALLKPAPEDLLEVYEVSSAVNRVANDAPGLIEPLGSNLEAQVSESADRSKAKPRKRRNGDDGQPSLF